MGYWSVGAAGEVVIGNGAYPEEAHYCRDVFGPAPAKIRHVDEAADEWCE